MRSSQFRLQTSCLLFFLQNSNALVDSSGSRFKEERDKKDKEFIMLIDVKTGNALHVKERPIVALRKSGSDNQKWKYLTPEPSVRINYILFSSFLSLVANIHSLSNGSL